MKKIITLTFLSVALSSCALVPNGLKRQAAVVQPTDNSDGAPVRPEARPQQQAEPIADILPVAAPAPPVAVSGALGTTVASLGSPAEPGLWLKTPLVGVQQSGRVTYNGKSINVTLIPLDGPKTGGSRMSLQGFQTLGAPLTDLVEVAVST